MRRLSFFAIAMAMASLIGCAETDRPPCAEDREISTICNLRNPEDLEYVPTSSIVLVSNMRHEGAQPDGGYLSAIVPGEWAARKIWGGDGPNATDPAPDLGDPHCTSPPVATEFYPHGLTSLAAENGPVLAYVAAHAGELGGREAVEIFAVEGEGAAARLTWKACIPSEGAVQLNDLAVREDGLVVASNYLPDASIVHSIRASVFRQPTGDIMTWKSGQGWKHLEHTESLLANGVALSPDGKTVFYTESIAGKLHRRSLDDAVGAIDIDLDGLPDNLTWTTRGTLLVGVHEGGLALMTCFLRAGACRAAWSVYEVIPETMAAHRILANSGDSIGAVATAIDVGDELLLSSVAGDRIARMPRSGTDSGRNRP